MQQRRATEAVWTTSAYVLAAGELGITTDSGIIKIGDGVNAWGDLDPAFNSDYLPILGKAADSELLDGIGSGGFWQTADATTTATADKLVKRTANARIKGGTATEADDLVTLAQLDATDADVATNTANIATNIADINNLEVNDVANRAALLALSTGSLRYGYTVRQVDKGYLWMWDLTAWRYMGKPGGDNPWCRITRGSIAWGTTNQMVWGYTLAENQDTDMFSWIAGTSTASPGGITVTETGKYEIRSYAGTDVGSAYYAYATHSYPSIGSTLVLSKLKYLEGQGITSGFADFTTVDRGWLTAGQKAELNVNMNVNGTLRSAQILVMRVPSN
jgi:hypothetical protein